VNRSGSTAPRFRRAAITSLVIAGLAAVAGPSGASSTVGVARAAAVIGEIDQPGRPTVPARRIPVAVETVSIGQSGPLSPVLAEQLETMAAELRIPSARTRAFNLGLLSVRRGDAVVQQAAGPGGVWQFPMSTSAMPIEAAGRVFGSDVSAVLGAGAVVMGQTTASLRGAAAGDVIDVLASDGSVRTYLVGLIAPDAKVGAELLVTPEIADDLGATVVTRVLLFGVFDRATVDAAIAARGWVDGYGVRINRSWNPPNPDGVLSSARTKALLGEFDYRDAGNGFIAVDGDWYAASLVQRTYAHIPIRANCHRAIVDDLQAALTEVAAAGLSWAIDVGNSNTYGGCWNGRFSRVSGVIGNVSRHSWGMAIDMNTVTNAQGRTPQMDCRVVRIFRKYGFAWGGNFLTPDGMHFEWVGEPRHEWQYPSKYCPNLPGGAIG
jgi:hypothetical protein